MGTDMKFREIFLHYYVRGIDRYKHGCIGPNLSLEAIRIVTLPAGGSSDVLLADWPANGKG